jgi:hypothetical protein
MDRPVPEQTPASSRGFSGALARGLALLLVAAVAAHAADAGALCRTLSRGVGAEASALRWWPPAFVRVVRGVSESEWIRGAWTQRGLTGSPAGASGTCRRAEGRAVLARERVVILRLDLPPPIAA